GERKPLDRDLDAAVAQRRPVRHVECDALIIVEDADAHRLFLPCLRFGSPTLEQIASRLGRKIFSGLLPIRMQQPFQPTSPGFEQNKNFRLLRWSVHTSAAVLTEQRSVAVDELEDFIAA